MKNRIILIAASIAAMVVSCQKEVVPTSNVKTEPMVLTSGVETKTILNGNKVLWTPGDAIMVIDNKGGINEFAIDNTITGNVEKAIFSGEVADQTSKFLAVYPSTCVDVNSSSYASTFVTIPIAQTPKAGSFETNHNVTVAHGSKTPGTAEVTGVQFKNVGGLLKFTLPTTLTNIKKVSLSSTTAIAGQMKVTPNNDGFTTEFVGTAKEVIMTPGENGYFTCVGDANTFWFAVAPVSLTDLTISVIDGNGNSYSMTKTWAADSPLKIEAGKYKNLGTIDMKLAGITTAHTYASNTLTGTEVTVTVPDNTKALTLTIKRGSDVIWENVTTSSETAVKTFVVSGAEKYTSYPYLPKGTYTLSGKYTIEGKGTEVVLGEKSFTITEDPNFTVTPATPMTSYSEYKLGNISTANEMNALEIKNLHSSQPSFSADMIKSGKYSFTRKSTISGASSATEAASTTVSAYGEYTVVSEITFDGVTKSSAASAPCYITGLPYTLTPTENDNVAPWQTNQSNDVTWGASLLGYNISSLKIGSINTGGETYLQKTFNLPENVLVSISCSGETSTYTHLVSTGWFSGRYDYYENASKVTVSGTTIIDSAYSGTCTNSLIDVARQVDKKFSTESNTIVTLTKNNPIIRIANIKENIAGLGTVVAAACYTGVSNLEVKYSN